MHTCSQLQRTRATSSAVAHARSQHQPIVINCKKTARPLTCHSSPSLVVTTQRPGSGTGPPRHVSRTARAWSAAPRGFLLAPSYTTRMMQGAMQVHASAAAATTVQDNAPLKFGIVGFGTFGQFLAAKLVQCGHQVVATSRTSYAETAKKMGVVFLQDADSFCEEHPDVVILCTSILSSEAVLRALPLERLRRNTLIMDVLSVKEFPKQLLLSKLPPEMDILCTHPMFGPDSAVGGNWGGLNFMYDKVRIGPQPSRQLRCQKVLDVFEHQGCNMVEMTCTQHDQHAASSQFITHTVGRLLEAMALQSTPINTKGFESLLQLVDQTSNDSFELYYGLFMYNNCAMDELERLESALDEVKRTLFTRLHRLTRSQLLPSVAKLPVTPVPASPPAQPVMSSIVPAQALAAPASAKSNGNGTGYSSGSSSSHGKNVAYSNGVSSGRAS